MKFDAQHLTLAGLEAFQALPAPAVSFEFFPPKSPEMEISLWNTIRTLEALKPKFVSVTYGAGGSTRERTHQTVKRIKDETTLTPAAHLTCVGASRDEIDAVAKAYWEAGVRHIVALRGDPPDGTGGYKPHPGGYPYCADLVAGLKKLHGFEISVAAFPEVHPEAVSAEADLDYLKKKVDAGATQAITQFFFNPELYLRFVERARKHGITIPILPGILLISNFGQLLKFNQKCGASIPKWVHNLLDGTDNQPEQRETLAALIAAEQCRTLRQEGVDHIHFYTLNRPTLAAAVCRVLGIGVPS